MDTLTKREIGEIRSDIAALRKRINDTYTVLYETISPSGGPTAPLDAPFLMVANDARFSAERALAGGSGITLTDAGANSTLTVAIDTTYLNGIYLRNPATGALDMGGYNITNVGTVDGVDVSGHSARHANSGVDAVNHNTLQNYDANRHIDHTAVSGIAGNGLTGGGNIASDFTLNVGAGAGISVAADSVAVDVAYAFTWTGDHTFSNADVSLYRVDSHIIPKTTDTYDIGTDNLQWLRAYIREVYFQKQVVEELIFDENGHFAVSKSAMVVASDIGTGDVTISVESNGAVVGDLLRCINVGKIEYMRVSSGPTGSGPYSYGVVRNLDGSGANTWDAGEAVAVLGKSGEGWIEIVGGDARVDIIQLTGTAYNDQDVVGRLGVLGTIGPYTSEDGAGFYLGDYDAGNYMTYDITGGLRVYGTIQGTSFTNDVGGILFGRTDGLALWNAYSEIDTAQWVSTRGQAMTLSGAFHQEAGRWVNSRALVVEEATTNIITNPSFETNTTGWSSSWGDTVTQSTDQARYGVYSLKIDGDGATAGTGVRYDASVSAATTYTFSAWIYVPSDFDGGDPELRCYDGAGFGSLLASSSTITERDRWVRRDVTATPTLTTLRVIIFSPTGAANNAFYADGAQIEAKGYATTYCDGSLGNGYSWSGTAHASTSTRTATNPTLDDYAGLISGNDTFSIACWARMPYDYDATWPGGVTTHYFWRLTTSDTMSIDYDSSNERFDVVYKGAEVINGGAQTFSAGEWIHSVLTVDCTNNLITHYVNGVEDGQYTTAITNATFATWDIGQIGNSFHSGMWFDEYAVFDTALTANEAAELYHFGRPLIDAGALNTPGIYLLDGKFRLASSTAGVRTELVAAGLAVYNGSGTTSVGRLLVGLVDTTGKVLDETASDLGAFGYDSSNNLQVAWYASGSNAGKIVGGGGNALMDSGGFTVFSSSSYADSRAYKINDGTNTLGTLYAYTVTLPSVINYVNLTAEAVSSKDTILVLQSSSASGKDATVSIGAVEASGGPVGEIVIATDNGTATSSIQLGSDTVTALGVYSTTVGGTNRDVYVDDTGLLGYVSSSRRYKQNIVAMESVDWLYALRPVEFDYKADGIHAWGLIAEEVDAIQTMLVSFNDKKQPEAVEYSRLIVPLLKAVQEIKADIVEIKQRL